MVVGAAARLRRLWAHRRPPARPTTEGAVGVRDAAAISTVLSRPDPAAGSFGPRAVAGLLIWAVGMALGGGGPAESAFGRCRGTKAGSSTRGCGRFAATQTTSVRLCSGRGSRCCFVTAHRRARACPRSPPRCLSRAAHKGVGYTDTGADGPEALGRRRRVQGRSFRSRRSSVDGLPSHPPAHPAPPAHLQAYVANTAMLVPGLY